MKTKFIRIWLAFMIVGLISCGSPDGLTEAEQVYHQHFEDGGAESLQGYSITRRGNGYYMRFPSTEAKFAFVWEDKYGGNLQLINQASIEKAFPGYHDWSNESVRTDLYAEARKLIDKLESIDAYAILGRNNDKSIRVFISRQDILVYLPSEERNNLDYGAEEVRRVAEHWFYVRRAEPLDL